jgi:hypothetical protein
MCEESSSGIDISIHDRLCESHIFLQANGAALMSGLGQQETSAAPFRMSAVSTLADIH